VPPKVLGSDGIICKYLPSLVYPVFSVCVRIRCFGLY